TGFSPAFRTTKTASLKCLPSQHARAKIGEAISTHFVKVRSRTVTFPTPAPEPEWAEPLLLRPHDQERTSISFLCLESCASPLTESILMNMSIAIGHCPFIFSARSEAVESVFSNNVGPFSLKLVLTARCSHLCGPETTGPASSSLAKSSNAGNNFLLDR